MDDIFVNDYATYFGRGLRQNVFNTTNGGHRKTTTFVPWLYLSTPPQLVAIQRRNLLNAEPLRTSRIVGAAQSIDNSIPQPGIASMADATNGPTTPANATVGFGLPSYAF